MIGLSQWLGEKTNVKYISELAELIMGARILPDVCAAKAFDEFRYSLPSDRWNTVYKAAMHVAIRRLGYIPDFRELQCI